MTAAVFIVAAVAIGYIVAVYAVLRRFDGSREAPGHAGRATEHRARAMGARVTSWFWQLDAWHPSRAARERIALRARGITLTHAPGAGMVAGENPARLHISGHETPAPGPPPATPEPTRLATEAERHEAAQDGPLYSWQTGEFAAIADGWAS